MATLHEKAQAQRIAELETALAAMRAEPKQPGFTAADLARREDEETRKLMRCVDKANSVLAFVFVAVVIVTLLQCMTFFATLAAA